MLVCVVIVLVAVWINRTLNHQVNMIIELTGQNTEHFPTPNQSWNQAASFVNKHNYLLTSAQNKIYKKDKPALLPSTNQTRGVMPFNDIAPTKDHMEVEDANSVTGKMNTVKWKGAKNWTTLRGKNTENNEIKIEGADIKQDKVRYTAETPTIIQKNDIAEAEEGKDMTDVPFSTNSRTNATAAVDIMTPTEGQVEEAIAQTFKRTYKNGKF